jgi:hypothetical protein
MSTSYQPGQSHQNQGEKDPNVSKEKEDPSYNDFGFNLDEQLT